MFFPFTFFSSDETKYIIKSNQMEGFFLAGASSQDKTRQDQRPRFRLLLVFPETRQTDRQTQQAPQQYISSRMYIYICHITSYERNGGGVSCRRLVLLSSLALAVGSFWGHCCCCTALWYDIMYCCTAAVYYMCIYH